jgi:hypothetical protein
LIELSCDIEELSCDIEDSLSIRPFVDFTQMNTPFEKEITNFLKSILTKLYKDSRKKIPSF